MDDKKYKEIESFCVDNPDVTVGEIAKKYKIPVNIAFTIVKEASKKLPKEDD